MHSIRYCSERKQKFEGFKFLSQIQHQSWDLKPAWKPSSRTTSDGLTSTRVLRPSTTWGITRMRAVEVLLGPSLPLDQVCIWQWNMSGFNVIQITWFFFSFQTQTLVTLVRSKKATWRWMLFLLQPLVFGLASITSQWQSRRGVVRKPVALTEGRHSINCSTCP